MKRKQRRFNYIKCGISNHKVALDTFCFSVVLLKLECSINCNLYYALFLFQRKNSLKIPPKEKTFKKLSKKLTEVALFIFTF